MLTTFLHFVLLKIALCPPPLSQGVVSFFSYPQSTLGEFSSINQLLFFGHLSFPSHPNPILSYPMFCHVKEIILCILKWICVISIHWNLFSKALDWALSFPRNKLCLHCPILSSEPPGVTGCHWWEQKYSCLWGSWFLLRWQLGSQRARNSGLRVL